MEATAIAGKRQRCSREAEPSTNAAGTNVTAAAVLVSSRPRVPLPEVLSGEFLWRALVCLPISDIARSERICREWRRILRSDDAGRALWRKVAIRSSSQAAVDALAATFASHDEDGRVDFMRLAICLAKEPPRAKPPPTPTLRPEDLFAFVHVEEIMSIGSGAEGQTEYQTVGAYTVADPSPLFETYEYGTHGIVRCEELGLIIEGANPLARGADETEGGSESICKALPGCP